MSNTLPLTLSPQKQKQKAEIEHDLPKKVKIEVRQKQRFKTNERVAKKIIIGLPIFQRDVVNARAGYTKLL